jgi:hypothetical protein
LLSLGERLRRGLRACRGAAQRALASFARFIRLGHLVVLDYPPTARDAPAARTGGRLHDLVAAGVPDYRRSLRVLAEYEQDLARIPRVSADDRRPAWINEFLPGLDGAAIYGFIRSRGPGTYMEIGSGNSTRFARAAIDDEGLSTRIVSIDPHPRAEIDALCDEVVRSPLETASPEVFDRLGEGDVLFFDGSHRVFTGSDVTVFFLDLLPRVSSGVLVGVHDVYLPDDYPADIWRRNYSEQYVLAAFLLGGSGWLRPVLAADYVSRRPDLAAELASLWQREELRGIETHGVTFWFEIGAAG